MDLEPGARLVLQARDMQANAILARHGQMLLTFARTAAESPHGVQGSVALVFHRGHPGYADFTAAMQGLPHLRSNECCGSLFRRQDAVQLLVALAGESARKAAGALRSLTRSEELPVVLLVAGHAHLAMTRSLGLASPIVLAPG